VIGFDRKPAKTQRTGVSQTPPYRTPNCTKDSPIVTLTKPLPRRSSASPCEPAAVAIRRQWVHYNENMTSCTKPEVYSMSQRRQRRTEPQPQAINVHRKFGEVWSCSSWDILAYRQTDRQTHTHTDKHAHINTALPLTGSSLVKRYDEKFLLELGTPEFGVSQIVYPVYLLSTSLVWGKP